VFILKDLQAFFAVKTRQNAEFVRK
jgi:hypothetical protein